MKQVQQWLDAFIQNVIMNDDLKKLSKIVLRHFICKDIRLCFYELDIFTGNAPLVIPIFHYLENRTLDGLIAFLSDSNDFLKCQLVTFHSRLEVFVQGFDQVLVFPFKFFRLTANRCTRSEIRQCRR